MKDCAKVYLNRLGYTVNEEAMEIIRVCSDWYANRLIEDFHVRKNLNGVEQRLNRMNFAKRCCADDANLCEIISVVPTKADSAKEFIKQMMQNNRFDVRYREQLEQVSAMGTVGAYICLKDAEYHKSDDDTVMVKGGKIGINYVDAECIIPLTVENNLVTECAFCSTNREKCKEKTTLVIFTRNDGKYQAETVIFDESGKIVDEESRTLQLGEVKPFALMINAEVNNLDNMEGYGLPKIYNNIPLFKALDLCYNILYGDFDKGQKLVFLNELLASVERDKDGIPRLTKQQKEIFILLGREAGKLPAEKDLVQEYNPKIRVDEITKAFELILSLLSISFGYGSKKYTFENGKITTATEYIGTRQDAMQELNKQRKQAVDYITDIIHAAMWFANQFQGEVYNLEEKLSVEFDDSYIVDKQTQLEQMRDDALSFDIPWITIQYLMAAYNISEQEAKELIEQKQQSQETDTDGEEED